MAEKSDVENWLSSLSYQELRKLAGEYGFKKNQKLSSGSPKQTRKRIHSSDVGASDGNSQSLKESSWISEEGGKNHESFKDAEITDDGSFMARSLSGDDG
ncbi:unnamed protein product [Enterobius vermicularis]|uniref:SAM domain-containing protein n=1 Tax=Enterobius vermicularis TaxID=51028 RepID=A0A0N4UVJ4_ENTVE|nr:unnamed protein product [Enterobius vermicularis]